jgi:ribosome-associated toxin RatA of RatAB toxin-antitoxin module
MVELKTFLSDFDVPQIRKSVLVPYSVRRMFDLVADVPAYPQFMPWCGGAHAEPASDGRVRACIEIDFRGVRSGFTTLNRHFVEERIEMEFAEGPFSELGGLWRFTALKADACKVEFELDYEFASSVLGRLIAPVFDLIANTFIDAFARRAEALYG